MKNSKKLSIRRISDKRARKEMEDLFAYKLSKGIKKAEVLGVSADLKISENQVEKIFNDFIKEGSAKSV